MIAVSSVFGSRLLQRAILRPALVAYRQPSLLLQVVSLDVHVKSCTVLVDGRQLTAFDEICSKVYKDTASCQRHQEPRRVRAH